MSSFEDQPLIQNGAHLQESAQPILDLPKRQDGSK